MGRRPRPAGRVPARDAAHPVDQPAGPARPGARGRGADRRGAALEGLAPEVLEPFARPRARWSPGSEATAPAATRCSSSPTSTSSPPRPEGWTHGPFDGDVADGYVWGRGAVDMKAMVALAVGVMRLLAARARGGRPRPRQRPDPRPPPRHPVRLAPRTRRPAAGEGAGWIVEQPAGAAAGRRRVQRGGRRQRGRSAGAASTRSRSRRRATRSTGSTSRGRWGHGSHAPRRQRRGPRGRGRPPPRDAGRAADHAGGAAAPRRGERGRWARSSGGSWTRPRGDDPRRGRAAIGALCDPIHARDPARGHPRHVQPGRHPRGHEVQRHPGRGHGRDRHAGRSPARRPGDIREELLARLGDLVPVCELEHLHSAIPFEMPVGDVYELLAATIRAARPGRRSPSRCWRRSPRTASTSSASACPTYGFSPLLQEPGEGFLDNFHGVDERVGVESLRWGLPVLYDAGDVLRLSRRPRRSPGRALAAGEIVSSSSQVCTGTARIPTSAPDRAAPRRGGCAPRPSRPRSRPCAGARSGTAAR